MWKDLDVAVRADGFFESWQRIQRYGPSFQIIVGRKNASNLVTPLFWLQGACAVNQNAVGCQHAGRGVEQLRLQIRESFDVHFSSQTENIRMAANGAGGRTRSVNEYGRVRLG